MCVCVCVCVCVCPSSPFVRANVGDCMCLDTSLNFAYCLEKAL